MSNTTELMNEGGYLSLIRCELKAGQFRPRGEPEQISLKQALNKFTPNQRSGSVILRARAGNYLCLIDSGSKTECFVIANRNNKGDISWLLAKKPDFSASIKEVYVIKDINRSSTQITESK